MEQEPEIQRWSCHTCHTHFKLPKEEKNPRCPECGETFIAKRCPLDPEGGCHCAFVVNPTVKNCELCGFPICPTCGDHDVAQVSRVTGYLSTVSGWNNAKKQELKDRSRWNLGQV